MTVATEKTPRRLGRGLEALLGSTTGLASSDEGALKSIPISQIARNPFQPRKEFNAEELGELEESLKVSGLVQPITVRRRPGRDGFELIAGERRLRAATRLGWKEIPAIIKEIDDKTILTLALVENLQRTDLNPIEEAEGYHHLSREFGLTQQQIAETVGKDRTTIANMLRLLQLPENVRKMLQEGQLTMGHAKVLLGLNDPTEISSLAREIVKEGLTVREVEQRLRQVAGSKSEKKAGRPRAIDRQSPEARRIEERLRRFLQTDAVIRVGRANRGTLTVHFYSADDLERLLEIIGVPD
ncbi:MAG TPA: ParB/RepB/Spo0J family partition protein [Gemmatimonadaceae bacterium]|jgi:ParB family chromosome partitioning protein|nr:ParB/RepB/Spo0J family partition protein [Gemmatimonadaceae bacterium]